MVRIMEYLKFPKKCYYLTQGFGYNSYSHQNRKALDVSQRGGYKEIYAPFSGYIANIYLKKGQPYTIWLVSNEKVMCANGELKYVVFMMTHPNKISNYKIKQSFSQDDYLFDDGTTGNVAAHLDFEIAVYDDKNKIDPSWHYEKGGNGLNNSVNPCDYILLSDDTIILNEYYKPQNKYYRFKKIKDINDFVPGNYQTIYNMNVRSGPGINYKIKKVKEITVDGKKNSLYKNLNSNAIYKKGTIFTAIKIIKNKDSSIWAKSPSGYICLYDKKNYYAKKIN